MGDKKKFIQEMYSYINSEYINVMGELYTKLYTRSVFIY